MLDKTSLKFLQELQKNNNKIWFEDHRNQYDTAKENFCMFVNDLIASMTKFDASLANLQAKDCTFRINRDVRFSKDKRPYKNNIAAYFNRGGKKANGAGYYIHIEPGKSFAAGGLWVPPSEDLARIRQEIDYNYNDWKKIISASNFKKQIQKGIDTGDVLIRPPKGYAEDNPAIRYLKMKSFVARRPFTDTEVLSTGFIKEAAKTFQVLKPMIDFMNRALD